jgi:hypothetical protein
MPCAERSQTSVSQVPAPNEAKRRSHVSAPNEAKQGSQVSAPNEAKRGSQVSAPNEAKRRSRRRTKRSQFEGSACETPAIGAGEDGGGVVEQEGREGLAGKTFAEEGCAGREEVVAVAEPGVGNPGAGVDHGDIAG